MRRSLEEPNSLRATAPIIASSSFLTGLRRPRCRPHRSSASVADRSMSSRSAARPSGGKCGAIRASARRRGKAIGRRRSWPRDRRGWFYCQCEASSAWRATTSPVAQELQIGGSGQFCHCQAGHDSASVRASQTAPLQGVPTLPKSRICPTVHAPKDYVPWPSLARSSARALGALACAVMLAVAAPAPGHACCGAATTTRWSPASTASTSTRATRLRRGGDRRQHADTCRRSRSATTSSPISPT